jgi:hypothetical protein
VSVCAECGASGLLDPFVCEWPLKGVPSCEKLLCDQCVRTVPVLFTDDPEADGPHGTTIEIELCPEHAALAIVGVRS